MCYQTQFPSNSVFNSYSCLIVRKSTSPSDLLCQCFKVLQFYPCINLYLESLAWLGFSISSPILWCNFWWPLLFNYAHRPLFYCFRTAWYPHETSSMLSMIKCEWYLLLSLSDEQLQIQHHLQAFFKYDLLGLSRSTNMEIQGWTNNYLI